MSELRAGTFECKMTSHLPADLEGLIRLVIPSDMVFYSFRVKEGSALYANEPAKCIRSHLTLWRCEASGLWDSKTLQFPVTRDGLAPFLLSWLSTQATYPKAPQTDGSSAKGWGMVVRGMSSDSVDFFPEWVVWGK